MDVNASISHNKSMRRADENVSSRSVWLAFLRLFDSAYFFVARRMGRVAVIQCSRLRKLRRLRAGHHLAQE